jgi:hypothetical protein
MSLQTLEKSRRVTSGEWGGVQGMGIPLYPMTVTKLCPERHDTMEEVSLVQHLTGKLIPQGHGTKQCSPIPRDGE